jgi:hypothetical protein
MRFRFALGLLLLAVVACEKPLTPEEKAAKDRSECTVIAMDQSGFDPVLAEPPPRTVSTTQQRGGTSGEAVTDVAKGAAGGAVVGVVGGAIMGKPGTGAAAGAAMGGLIGGARHYQKRNEMVTTTRPNPEYERYMNAKAGYKRAFDDCLASRAEAKK